MREVFRPEPAAEDDELLFYTIIRDDVRKGSILTTAGRIDVTPVLGFITTHDVGRRLYRVPSVNGGHVWQAENDAQRDHRLARA